MTRWRNDPLPEELLDQMPPGLVALLGELEAAGDQAGFDMEWAIQWPGGELPPDKEDS